MNKLINDKVPKIMFFCIAVSSMSFLAFEISLTRLLSVMLSYHYVYGVTSFALLGSGIGAFIIHFNNSKTKDKSLTKLYNRFVIRICLSSVTMILSIIIVIQINKASVSNIMVLGILLCIPFIWEGMFLADVFRIFPDSSGKLYFADLLGAASGCILAVLSLSVFGDAECVILFSVMISVASLLLALFCHAEKKIRLIACAGTALIIILILISIKNEKLFQIPIGTNSEKEIYDSIHIFNGQIADTRWSAFGRTDLVKYDQIPYHMDIYIDGTAGTPMYRFNGDINEPDKKVAELRSFPGYFPFQFIESDGKNNALIIGPGGGRDVLIALLGGVEEISAVEVNPDLVDIVKDYSDYNGGIYTSTEKVNVIVDEGRGYLRSHENEKYDVIMMTLPKTNTSRSREGYALTENYLFTTDSIREYLDRLNENGHLLLVANDDAEILRLLTLTLSVYKDRNVSVSKAMNSLYILGSAPNPVIVLKKGSFDDEMIEKIYHDAINVKGYNPYTSYFPFIDAAVKTVNPVLYDLANSVIDIEDLINMVNNIGYDIRPVSDNNPFYYKLTSGLPRSISAVLLFSFILIIIMGAALLFTLKNSKNVRDKKTQKKSGEGKGIRKTLKYILIFCMSGIGYMIMEIALIQKFVFFLGKPVLSLSVILFTVLCGTGIGSFLSNLIKKGLIIKYISISAISISSILIAYNFILIPVVFKYFFGFDNILRIFISVIILLPLCIVMGIPFPLAVRSLNEDEGNSLIPWMWGINAGSSVFGSVFAMAAAIVFGFNEAVIAGAVCYLIIFFSSRSIKNNGLSAKTGL